MIAISQKLAESPSDILFPYMLIMEVCEGSDTGECPVLDRPARFNWLCRYCGLKDDILDCYVVDLCGDIKTRYDKEQ